MIKPTVGRVVLFHPSKASGMTGFANHGSGPLAAIIAHVWTDACVNLSVFDSNGVPHSRTSVALIQDGQTAPEFGYYCEWMPYQKGQAAKTEALEQKIAAAAEPPQASSKSLIDEMVNRFLGWKLPKDFGPDAGISFKPTKPDGYDEPGWWPVGTNLLTADQARQMFEHVLGDALPLQSASDNSLLNFGEALQLLKAGAKVARLGWNGKSMWLAMSPGAENLPADKFWAGPNREYAEQNGGAAKVLPCITMKTATGEILMGWLASQTDMLAEDWVIVE